MGALGNPHRGLSYLNIAGADPVNCKFRRFYDKLDVKMDILDFFRGVAVTADQIPDLVFGSVGRAVWRDLGPTAVAFRIMMKFMDFGILAAIAAEFAPFLPDFRRNLRQAGTKVD